MTRKPEHDRVPLQPAGDALDLFPTEGTAAGAAAEPPKPALLHVTPAGEFAPIVEMPPRATDEAPRLDGAIEPEPLPPLAIGAAAAAVVLIVLMGVAVLFQRQRRIEPASTFGESRSPDPETNKSTRETQRDFHIIGLDSPT